MLNSLRGRGKAPQELEVWALTRGGPRLDQEQRESIQWPQFPQHRRDKGNLQ